jgi:hypothetical protein
MKIFQKVWGYIVLASFVKLVSVLFEMIFNAKTNVIFLILFLLSLLLFRIHPLKGSNYPFGFQIELKLPDFHLKF